MGRGRSKMQSAPTAAAEADLGVPPVPGAHGAAEEDVGLVPLHRVVMRTTTMATMTMEVPHGEAVECELAARVRGDREAQAGAQVEAPQPEVAGRVLPGTTTQLPIKVSGSSCLCALGDLTGQVVPLIATAGCPLCYALSRKQASIRAGNSTLAPNLRASSADSLCVAFVC